MLPRFVRVGDLPCDALNFPLINYPLRAPKDHPPLQMSLCVIIILVDSCMMNCVPRALSDKSLIACTVLKFMHTHVYYTKHNCPLY